MKHAFCLLAVATAFAMAGCEKETTPAPQAAPAARTAPEPTPTAPGAPSTAQPTPAGQASAQETTTVKAMQEYRNDAAKTITADNAQAELTKLEKEIAADE